MCRETINVIISDWQILFREGIHFAVSSEEDLMVAGETLLNTEVIKLVESNVPDLVIFNNRADPLSGVETMRIIRRSHPALPVILTFDVFEEREIFNAIKNGAQGCIWKDNDTEEVLKIVRSVCKGSYPSAALLLKQGIAAMALKEFELHIAEDEILADFQMSLTSSETNILQCAVDRSSQVTGDQSYDDIVRHLESIRFKLVENQRHYEIFSAAKAQLSVLEDNVTIKEPETFITKEEFNVFRRDLEQLLKHFFVNDMSLKK